MFINMKHWENARMRDQNNKQKRTHNFSHVPRLYLYVFFFILLVSQHFAVRQHGIASPTTSTPFADTASLWRLFWFRFHLNKCFVIWFSPTARSHRTILQCASHNTTMPGYTISWTSLIIALEEFLYFVFSWDSLLPSADVVGSNQLMDPFIYCSISRHEALPKKNVNSIREKCGL